MAKQPGNPSSSTEPADPDATGMVARVRWLMIISALTTFIAIAAVVGVIGYRVFHSGESSAQTIFDGTVFLPKDAHVVSTTVSGDRIVVTLDTGGTSEVRIYDLKDFKQTGRLRFATQP